MAGMSNFGGKKASPFKKGGGRAKQFTKASDAADDKKRGIKEGSPEDKKLDKERGVKDTARKQAKQYVKTPKANKKAQARESLNFAQYEKLDIELSYVGFNALKAKLAAKGASNPGALAAAIGRKKYGKAGMAKLSGAGHAGGAKHTFGAKKARASRLGK